MDSCKKFLCDEQIYSPSDWRKSLLKKKIELRNSGIINFEDNPIYKRITQCKQEKYFPESVCTNPETFRPKVPIPGYRYERPSPAFKERCPKGFRRNKITGECEPTNQTTQYKKCPTGFYRNPLTTLCEPNQTEALRTLDKKCPTGYRRNKKTEICDKITSNTTRCPAGYRRNKKTGICEPNIEQYQEYENTEPKQKRCPKGFRRNKKTGECEPTNK